MRRWPAKCNRPQLQKHQRNLPQRRFPDSRGLSHKPAHIELSSSSNTGLLHTCHGNSVANTLPVISLSLSTGAVPSPHRERHHRPPTPTSLPAKPRRTPALLTSASI